MTAFVRNTAYTGPVQAVVLDWAGTAVDFGSIGPAGVFVDVFAKFGIAITLSQVRRFMGLTKKDHVRCLLELPEVADQWRERHGVSPAEAAVDRLYAETEPMMTTTAARYANPIPGLLDTVSTFSRSRKRRHRERLAHEKRRLAALSDQTTIDSSTSGRAA